MAELRRDPLTQSWVIVAPEQSPGRAEVAQAARDPLLLRGAAACPLCPGAEVHTPPEVYAHRPQHGPAAHRDAPGWSLRVVPHRFPALGIEGDLGRRADGLYDRMNGVGAHEVIVDSPDHDAHLGALGEAEVEQVLWACRHRILDLRRDGRFRYLALSKAHGEGAGATLSHPHTQLLALPVLPRAVSERLRAAARHEKLRERCLHCDIVDQEVKDGGRLVYENSAFLVLCPYAARTPFETWVLPRHHRPAFEECPEGEVPALAGALRAALRRLDRALGGPCYRVVLHNAPFSRPLPPYHFSFEITPQVGGNPALGHSAGVPINPTPPEEAARYLRELRDEGPRP